MKILAFTDTHGSFKHLLRAKENSKKSQIAICCGDFTIFENDLLKTLKKIDSFPVPVLLIPGNHETDKSLSSKVKQFKNIIYIHKTSYQFQDYEFFGFGEKGFSLRDLEFKKISKEFLKKMKENKKNGIKNILVLHGPPYDTKLDDLGQNNHCGNIDYREFIIKAPISLTLAGHIHENFYAKDKLNNKAVLNPGPQGTLIDL